MMIFGLKLSNTSEFFLRLQRGWNKEFNIVSWNGSSPKYDVREWDPTHRQMTRGITMTREELEQLAELISAELGAEPEAAASSDR